MEHTYATEEEISNALSQILPEKHAIMSYSRDEQIMIAMKVVQQTGKSIRINAMNIHPSTPISFGEGTFRIIATLISFVVIAIIGMGVLISLADAIWH